MPHAWRPNFVGVIYAGAGKGIMLFIVVAYSICIIDRINKDPNTGKVKKFSRREREE